MNSERTVSIIVAPEPQLEDDAKGLFRRPGLEAGIVKEVPLEQLQRELDSLSRDLGEMFDTAADAQADPHKLHLSELSVQVEITASGGINLIGSANVGATASMTLTFSRG